MREIFFQSIQNFRNHNLPRYGAAIAYYMIFCIAPLFVFLLSLLGIFLKDPGTNLVFFQALQELFGREAVNFLQNNLESHSLETNIWLTVIGLFFALLGASAVFKELKCGLDTIFEVQQPEANFLDVVRKNITVFGMVIVLGLFLTVSLLSTMAMSIMMVYFQPWLAFDARIIELFNFSFSFLILTALFMVLHTFVPDAKIPFRLTLVGSVVTALLFTLGKTLFGIYLGTIGIGSAYGAAGSILVLLVWIFYSTQIFFFGAVITAEVKKNRAILEKII